jgi:tRNA (adenine37-N6)-methyltransferase
MESVSLKPIGVVHRSDSDEEVKQDFPGREAVIEIYPHFREGLDGLEGYSHLFVLGHFHKLRPEQIGPLKVQPRRMLQFGLGADQLPWVGVFALSSPTRPNPIGLSLVQLLRIESGGKLLVRGLEYFDGTPVLDIKPYQSAYRAEEYRLPRWATELALKAGLPPTESV